MKYRVTIDLSFDNKQDAVDLMNIVEKIKTKPISIQPSAVTSPTLTMPKLSVMYECRHDETPPMPCSNYQYVDFSGKEITWTTNAT